MVNFYFIIIEFADSALTDHGTTWVIWIMSFVQRVVTKCWRCPGTWRALCKAISGGFVKCVNFCNVSDYRSAGCRVHLRSYSIQHENQTNTAWTGIETEVEQNGVETGTGTEGGGGYQADTQWNGMGQRSPEWREVPVSDQRSLRVAIIGTPNSGKSTLVNQFLHQKVKGHQ